MRRILWSLKSDNNAEAFPSHNVFMLFWISALAQTMHDKCDSFRWADFVWKNSDEYIKTYGVNSVVVWVTIYITLDMMTSSNGAIFRVTDPLCGEFTGPGEFPAQRPVTRSFDVFFVLCLNKRLSKQPWGWWFETPSWPLWRQCNEMYK